MKRFIVGLLVGALMLTGIAFADPASKKLYKEGYGKIVYDIVIMKHDSQQYSGQGTAIGPHHILTAGHVVGPAKDIKRIDVITKKRTYEGGYKYIEAEVVKYGQKSNETHEKDWAIIKTKKKLKYWKALDTAKAEVGDTVYNASGNKCVWAMMFPIELIADSQIYYHKDVSTLDMYITTPCTIKGDSGSPVFNANGDLIGIVVAGNERTTLVVKAKRFKRYVRKYRGK